MTKFVRFTVCALLLVALSLVRPAWATSFSNDQSDLWWNSSENGWGIQFVERGKTIFATMFVYDVRATRPGMSRRWTARSQAAC